ncbi:uncharacterized protein LOC135109110 isoform X2 [Scylla paramamosain]
MMAFTASDCFRLKCLRILETVGEAVMTYTLKCGTHGKSSNVSLDEYLRALPQNSTANYGKIIKEIIRRQPVQPEKIPDVYQSHLRKQFTSTDMSQIKKSPSCAHFDITLLYKSIKLACENVAGISDSKWTHKSSEMEYLITEIKNSRNEVVHEKSPMSEEQFLTKLKELSVLLVSALEATQMRYCRPEAELKDKKEEVFRAFDDIRKDNIGEEEILQRSASKILPLFKMEANKELQRSLDCAKYLDPLHFLCGHENHTVDVQTVFSRIIITKEERSKNHGEKADEDEIIDYSKLLQITQAGEPISSREEPPGEQLTRPKIVLVEGDTGIGKTTLLTFILSEWLSGECDRRMEGLAHYDLLLWVVCREQYSSSLNGLLKQVLPEAHIKYGHLLLPLLKKCRVLVLVDGLDEMNVVSHQLVTSILSEGKESTNFTVICTSRPVNVFEFKPRIPKNYKTFHVKILGISPEERTHVVVKHYEWLTGGRSKDVDRLRQIMQNIGWRDLFRLPLNLLFLSTMAHYDMNFIGTTITQSHLYQFIHKWSVEKLHHRLAAHANVLHDRVLLEKKIDNVLKVIYFIALKGILEGRIYLSEEDQDLLTASCIREGVPREEVMPTFYSLRREVTFGVPKERYYAPHKGVQEFFAAQHIIDQVIKCKKKNIRSVLKNFMAGKKLRLQPLNNVLRHLLGLLTRQNKPVVKAMKETVNMIHKSGVKRIHDWMFLLTDIEAHPATVQHIWHRIKKDKDTEHGEIFIRDSTVHAAACLLPLIPSRAVNVIVERELPWMDTLLRAIGNHKLLRLWLEHHYTHPDPATSSGRLLQHVPRNHLMWFKGHINAEHLPLLPVCLQDLALAVAGSDHASTFLPALKSVLPSLPRLHNIVIHVPVTKVNPQVLTALPAVRNVSLILSAMGEQDVELAWRIAAALCPNAIGYGAIRFAVTSLTMAGWKRLLRGLARAGVSVAHAIVIPKPAITNEERRELDTLSKLLLGCSTMKAAPDMIW